MTSATLSENYIHEIMSIIATNLKLTNWKLNTQEFESIGQNYFGVIMPITLTGNKDNKTTTYQIVLKLAPTDERYRVSGAVTIMFQREIFVYSKLLSIYQRMQDSAISDLTQHFYSPTLYFARDEYCKEVIAMKDMREDGFKPYTHTKFLDLEHITIALESLARFHAMSYVLKERYQNQYDEVKGICVPLTENTNKRYMAILTDRLIKALTKFNGTDYQPLLENLKRGCASLFEAATETKGVCICHGDIWKENILFKYENNKPSQACIIDYQTTRISSPAFDALYLIISSTDSKLRRNNYYNLLDIYYKSFRQHLDQFGLSCDTYSRDEFDYDLKSVAPAVFITANTAMWLSHGLQQEGHVRSKIVLNTPAEISSAEEGYKSVITDIINDFYTYNYMKNLR